MSDKHFLWFFTKVSIIIVGAFIFFHILYLGKDFLIPLILAFFLSAALIRTHHTLQDKFKLPKIISLLATTLVYVWLLTLVAMIINNNVQSIVAQSGNYEEKIVQIVNSGLWIVGLEQTFSFENLIKTLNIESILSGIGSALTAVLASMSTILIYTAFILAEYKFLGNKAATLFSLSKDGKSLAKVFRKVEEDIAAYFKIHSFFSLGTGIGTYIICLALGIEFAAFWWLLAFLLNYIPTIWSALAAIIPVLFGVIQFWAWWAWEGVIALWVLLWMLQFAMGNVFEPKFLWSRLNLSPLVILLSLTFWGYIWGVIWMFLSIPLMVMINIICSHFESTKWIHVLLSQKGNIEKSKKKK